MVLTKLWPIEEPSQLQGLEDSFRALMTYAAAKKDLGKAVEKGVGNLEALQRACDDARRACPDSLPL